MLRVSQVKLTIDEDLDQLEEKLCKKLRISKDELIRFSIVRESIDARKDPIMFSYTLECEVRHEAALLRRRLRDVARAEVVPFTLPEQGSERLTHRPVVIGFGPSGMFAGLLLAQNGYRPIILERGSCVETPPRPGILGRRTARSPVQRAVRGRGSRDIFRWQADHPLQGSPLSSCAGGARALRRARADLV